MKKIRAAYRKHFLAAEFILAAILWGLFVALIQCCFGNKLFTEFLQGAHQGLYGTIASVAGSLLGFVITEVSIVLLLGQMPQMRIVRQSGHIGTIFQVNFQAIFWLGLATGWAFLGLIADTDTHPRNWITYGMMFFTMLVLIRVYRCIWILKVITGILSK